MRSAVCLMLLWACGAPVPLELQLHGAGEGLLVTRVLVEVQDEAGKIVASDSAEAQPGVAVKLPEIRLARKGNYVVGVSARVDATSALPALFGRAPLGVPERIAELKPLALMLAPVARFGAFGAQPKLRRSDPGVAALRNGEVWVIGGRDPQGAAMNAVERYDPKKLGFEEGPALATKRIAPAVTVVMAGERELIVVAGGETLGSVATTIEVIDPGADGGRVRPPIAMSSARVSAAIVTLPDGRALIAGGRNEKGEALTSCDVLTVDAFASSVAQGLAEGARLVLPEPRAGAAAVRAGDRVFLVGGSGLQSVLELVVSEGRFDTVTPLPTVRSDSPSAIADATTLYVSGGGADAIDAWPFSPVGVAKTVARPPGSRIRAQLALFPPRTLMLIGGEDGGATLARSRLFEPAQAALSSLDLVAARAGHRTVIADETLLVIGGASDGPIVEAYRSCEAKTSGGCAF